MANRITTGKRDREKLKEQKRKEKLQKKEERKIGGKSSFEDMIAYTDENGQLHSTPPEKSNTVIDVANILISTPKQEDVEIEPFKGRVEFFNDQKGYGFIKDLSSTDKYFFHISSAPEMIKEGDNVTFEIERGTRGINAVRISIIN
ncbi:MAG: cold shock domain-containing protein [Bacteroidales bacterium]|jgi:cold shock CspA family protein|nr:cold shock domain-containing protein [Bacteroidales bacterium]